LGVKTGRWLSELGFVQRVLLATGIPALTLLATKFPALRGTFFDWLQPLFRMLG